MELQQGLNNAMNRLRAALDENAESPTSSNREGARGAAGLGIGGQEGGEVFEAGRGTQEGRERSLALGGR